MDFKLLVEIREKIIREYFVILKFTAIEKTPINFDRVSVIHFDKARLIDSIKNYKSKSKHCFPYHIQLLISGKKRYFI